MEDISKKLRKDALYLSYKCRDGNLQSVFSCIDIVWVLYDKIMNWNPNIATDENRDYFIISKGQATLALYPVLIEKGMFKMKEVANEIGNFNSKYCIQADITKFNGGIENSAGSLGHGLPFAVGVAYGNKIKGLDNITYVLCGDGEFCEGTMWESLILACNKKLDNFCVIIDDNNSVGAMVSLDSIRTKLEAFGFETIEVDGHNMIEIENSFNELMSMKNGRPKSIIAHTIRGYGSKTMMENDIWFHKSPNDEELDILRKEVDEF